MAATPNYLLRSLLALGMGYFLMGRGRAGEVAGPEPSAGFRQQAFTNYTRLHAQWQLQSTNHQAGTRFAKACFDFAEFATNATERATLAEQGITASRELIRRQSNSAAARLYLAMNLGQLARTRTLGALTLVNEMETQFSLARRLDEHLEHAAPDRYLGLLYREAPSLISIGDRAKARAHLIRAAELEPQFPPNRLNLLESYLTWGEKAEARRQLKKLQALWPNARAKLSGPEWLAAWADWSQRLTRARKSLGD